MSSQSVPIAPDDDDDLHDAVFAKRRRCFCLPTRSASNSVFWQRINPLDSRSDSSAGDRWWRRGWHRMREWSEIVAGPKWKTLIRRIGRKRGRHESGKFNYDPMSYALNFDEGPAGRGDFDEDLVGRGFSSRYSLPPSAKCSLDFDKEGVVFT